jgi:Rod binding domain-containing protein
MKIDAIRPSFSETQQTGAGTAGPASDFEALLIGQMLKSARSDSDGWFGTGEDKSSESLIEMAEDQIAKVLAKGGGLGLAGMIERSLASQSETTGKPQADSSTVQISGKLR